MLGFSFPKIIILIIIIFLVWNFFKLIEKKIKTDEKTSDIDSFKKNGNKEEEALLECDTCGAFFSKNINVKCPVCSKEK